MRTNRKNNEMREIKVTKNFSDYPDGSVLIEVGKTKVICSATVEFKVPHFLKGSKKGWITAEYSMLPTSTHSRIVRESVKGKLSGRTMEIQRLIGRSLRAAIDLEKLGEISIIVDCDVIQADGGTRTASITGGYLAMELAIQSLLKKGLIVSNPIKSKVAAISVGKVNGEVLLDLNYEEDSHADVDLNIVMNSKGEFVELQGTGEETTFTYNELMQFISISKESFELLFCL